MNSRTRIVATLGPASDSDAVVRAMIRAGVDVVRLNFSHGDHAMHAARVERVRRLAAEEDAIVAILGDLQGPKLRVGKIPNGSLTLTPGMTLTLTPSVPAAAASASARVSVDFPELAGAVRPGDRVLLDDGRIELRVLSIQGSDIVTRVETGGELLSHKGMNLPGVALDVTPLTDKDRTDLVFAVEQGVDYIALSFVRRAEDVSELKRLLAARSAPIPVIAKIERPEALDGIDAILEASDGVMVARGDLGVEIPAEQVPIHQKRIIRKANAAGKPVITATQMLESMIENPRPTRAEASDVANAILDGTDAVMLSGETAIGRYPVLAVEMMTRIAREVEEGLQPEAPPRQPLPLQSRNGAPSITDAIGTVTCEMAEQLGARVILTATSSGYTARMIARHRPQTPIFAVTWNAETQRRLALVWGAQSEIIPPATSIETMIGASIEAARARGIVRNGDCVVITAGVPVGAPGRTNMVQVRMVREGMEA